MSHSFPPCLASLLLGLALTGPARAAEDPWALFAETGTIEIVTRDADGDLRETPVWIVVLEDAGYVRTNDSRWLANIRRGSPVTLRAKSSELVVRAEERDDDDEFDRVEEAFKTKYGRMQRLMSTFRLRRPTVLRLSIEAGE